MLHKDWILAVAVAAWWGCNQPVWSRPVPDHTLGRERSQVIDRSDRDFDIRGGARRGHNLFHSFREFDVDAGGSVYFRQANGVENIFSRVTGTNRSEILGRLGVRGDANLFLLNPNGILFGADASLDLQGSFVGTTATAIQFEAAKFDAADPTPPLLKVNPSAFLFDSASPGQILNRAELRVPNRAVLLLLGGDVTVRSGNLNAFGGQVELGAVESGKVELAADGLSFSDEVRRGDIVLNDTLVDVALDDGGNVNLTGDRIILENGSFIKAGIEAGFGTARSRAGDVRLNGQMVRLNQSLITDNVNVGAVGRAGNIVIEAEQVELNAGGALSQVNQAARGRGGNIVVRADLLTLTRGAGLTASTFGRGNAGNVTIEAEQAWFDGVSPNGQNPSGVFNNTAGVGQGGNITVIADSLRLTRGAQLTASTFGRGNAGNIAIEADQAEFNASGAFVTVQENSRGRGGNLTVSADSLRLTNAKLAASTFGQGHAGNVAIEAAQVRLNASSVDSLVEATGQGQGGNVEVTADSLRLTHRSQFDTSTFGRGDAGNVSINAGQARFDNSFALSQVARTGQGQGGSVTVNAEVLSLIRGAELTTSTFGQGNAGNVVVQADRADFDGTSPDGQLQSGIFNTVAGIGQGGNITVKAGEFSLTNGAQLGASTVGRGNAGNVSIDAANVRVNGTSANGQPSGVISTVEPDGQGQGGNVAIEADTLSFTDGAQLNVSTSGRGNAGNILMTAEQIKFEDSVAFSQVAETGQGRGGNISVNADRLSLTQGGELTSSTFGRGNAGNVVIDVDRAHFDGRNATNLSGIFNTVGDTGRGRGGDIKLTADSLALTHGAQLTVSTFGRGRSGDIGLAVDDLIELNQSSIFATAAPTATGQSGNIQISANGLWLFDRSRIRTDDQRPGTVRGGGGNIQVNANYILATNGSDVLAFSGGGRGGNIDLPLFFSQDQAQTNATELNRNQQAQLVQNQRIDIDASGRISGGAVGVVVPNTSNIQNSLADLPENGIDADRLLANSCIVRTASGTFLITGAGGLPESPIHPSTAYPTGEVRSVSAAASHQSWQPGDPIVEPQQVYRLANGRLVLSRDCQPDL